MFPCTFVLDGKSVCKGYVAEIKTYVEEPEKVAAFVAACGKLGVHIPSRYRENYETP